MKNSEIKQAIKKIIRIKMMQYEADSLLEQIIKEMEKRQKKRINLGGHNGDDFVGLKKTEIDDEAFKNLIYSIDLDPYNQVSGEIF